MNIYEHITKFYEGRKEEKKILTDKKKELQTQIKAMEAELTALGLKKAEIKKIRDEAKVENDD